MVLYGLANLLYEAVFGYDQQERGFLLIVLRASDGRGGEAERCLYNSAADLANLSLSDLREIMARYNLTLSPPLLEKLGQDAQAGAVWPQSHPTHPKS